MEEFAKTGMATIFKPSNKRQKRYKLIFNHENKNSNSLLADKNQQPKKKQKSISLALLRRSAGTRRKGMVRSLVCVEAMLWFLRFRLRHHKKAMTPRA